MYLNPMIIITIIIVTTNVTFFDRFTVQIIVKNIIPFVIRFTRYQYSMTAACDPRPLEPDEWHCVGHVYDGAAIYAYVNGTLVGNPAGGSLQGVPLPPSVNPYP